MLIDSAELLPLLQRLDAAHLHYALMHYSSLKQEQHHAVAIQHIADQAAVYAHRMYASMRWLDTQQAALIVVERPPIGDEWQGIHDRLRRAAFESSDVVELLLKH